MRFGAGFGDAGGGGARWQSRFLPYHRPPVCVRDRRRSEDDARNASTVRRRAVMRLRAATLTRTAEIARRRAAALATNASRRARVFKTRSVRRRCNLDSTCPAVATRARHGVPSRAQRRRLLSGP